jgi:hypothetical protein
MSIKPVCIRNSWNRTKLIEQAIDCITQGNISGNSKHFYISSSSPPVDNSVSILEEVNRPNSGVSSPSAT